jgi:metal-sulfur cluster biosynthetic enzyme
MPSVTEEQVMDALTTVNDPELFLSIVDLGLIYNVTISETNEIHVLMSLTTPGCPPGHSIAEEAEAVVMNLPGVKDVLIEITFEPPWTVNMMSEYAKDKLGIG